MSKPSNRMPHQILVRLTHVQKAKLDVLGARLGGDTDAERVRRAIEALHNAHSLGIINLDLIRYQTVTQGAACQERRSLSQWLEERHSPSDGTLPGGSSA